MKFPAAERKARSNKLGPIGWGYAGRYGVERYLYILHRLTGLGILLYLVMHIFVTGFKNDPAAWNAVMAFLARPLFRIGEYLLFICVAFHCANGIRLILTEFGFLLGKPKRPVYPYTTAMLRQRPVMILLMVIAGFIVVYGGIDFFILK